MSKWFLHVVLPIGMLLPVMIMAGCKSDIPELPECFDLQGHRGAMGLKPENTIPGFLHAVDHHVDTIEFDLAVTKEHKLVISHEPWFRSDICLHPDGSLISTQDERSFRLYDYLYAEIAEFDCGSLRHPSHPNQVPIPAKKPLMIDAIKAIDDYSRSSRSDPVRFNIEIKTNPAWDGSLTPEPSVFARLLHEELKEIKRNHDKSIFKRINVQSFDPRSLRAFREIAPSVPLAILTYQDETVDDHIDFFGFLPEIYSPNYGLLTPEHMRRAHDLGMRVIPWTVNRHDEILQMVRLGVDGIITDYPNHFHDLYPDAGSADEDCSNLSEV